MQHGKLFPAVNSEKCVRVKVNAPDAKSVQLDLGGKKYDLVKGEDGSWIGESGPQDEGFHYYNIVIDGASVSDPTARYFYGSPGAAASTSSPSSSSNSGDE